MWILLQIIFWLAIAAVGHTYVLYPLLLKRGMVPGRNRAVHTDFEQQGMLPRVAVVMAAHNEARIIEEKIHSVFASDYPKEQLEVWVGDDASTDGTTDILRRLQLQYPNLHVQPFPGRTGKPEIINTLVPLTGADILLHTDANIIFQKDAVRLLVQPFADTAVGFTAANILSRNVQHDGGISMQEDAYIAREIRIKELQTKHAGLVIAPFGALFAIRKSLYHPVPAYYTCDDFTITFRILAEGYKAVQLIDAIGYEDIGQQMEGEYKRKVRISRGNFYNLAQFSKVLAKPGPLAFHFISHKVLRWLTPHCILLAFIVCFALAFRHSFYAIALAGFLLLLLSPLLDALLRKAGVNNKLLRFAAYFTEMNRALLEGWWQFMRGQKQVGWKRAARA